jgi:hypothetical protein
MPDFSDTEGDLVFRQEFVCSEKGEANPIVLHLPLALVREGERNIEARVELFSKGGDFLDEFKPVTVHFPKPASTRSDGDKNGWSVMTFTPLKAGPVESGENSATSGQTGTPIPPAQGPSTSSTLTVDSVPVGADIFLDDDFVGNTPSTINVSLGNHAIIVRKLGFQDWVRNVNLYGSLTTLNAELAPTTDAMHTPNPPAATDSSKKSVPAEAPTNLSSQRFIGWIGIQAQSRGDVALVTNMISDSPGAKAGIQPGDVILALDGRLIKGRDFETLVAALKPGM